MKYTPFNTNWEKVLQALSIHELNVRGSPPYHVWALNNIQALISLMNNVNPRGTKFIHQIVQSGKPHQRILVCAAGATAFGEYFFSMVNRPARFDALLAMLWGHRNASPCSCCAKRYAGTVCSFERPDGADDDAHVNYPFLYCISHPGAHAGKCANCIYHITTECEYNQNHDKFKNYDCIQARAARVDTSPMKPVRRGWAGAPLKRPYDWEAGRDRHKASQERDYAPDDGDEEDDDEE